MNTGGQQHGGVAAVAAQSRATFATQLQHSLREQGITLGGKRGARLLREEYEDLARYALEKWLPVGEHNNWATGERSLAFRATAVALAGDRILPETDAGGLLGARVRRGEAVPSLAIATTDGVLVYHVAGSRTVQTVISYHRVVEVDAVTVDLGWERPAARLVFIDDRGQIDVAVVAVSDLDEPDLDDQRSVRDAWVAHVEGLVEEVGGPIDPDDPPFDLNELTRGVAWRRWARWVAVGAGVLVVIAVAVTAFLVLRPAPELAAGQCLRFAYLSGGSTEPVDCGDPAATYRVLSVIGDQVASLVGQTSNCPAGTALSAWVSESGEVSTRDDPPFNGLAVGRLVCLGSVG